MMEAYHDLWERISLGESGIPIKELPLRVTGVDAQLFMNVIVTKDGNTGENNMWRDVRDIPNFE